MTTSTAPSAQVGLPELVPSEDMIVQAIQPRLVPSTKPKVGLAFQGGSFLAGAIDAGVVRGLVEARAFDRYDITAFSGTSAGALVAAVCWRHALQEKMANAPEVLRRQWLHNAYGIIQYPWVGDQLKLLDYLWSSSNPIYFWWKDRGPVQWLHGLFRIWLDMYVEPETCMRMLYERYVLQATPPGNLVRAQEKFNKDENRPRLIVGATRVKDSEDVNITDDDFFAELINALKDHRGDPGAAIREAAEYMSQGIMASGSLDSINGMTNIERGRHAGTYLDGAWAENPPVKGLLDGGVNEIWIVEVFPKQCADVPNSFAQREDRREELWQNAVVEQQLAFINKVNLWLKTGQLISREIAPDEPSNDATQSEQQSAKPHNDKLSDLAEELRKKLQSEERADLLDVFRKGVDHSEDYIDNDEMIVEKAIKPYRSVKTCCIQLPPELQKLTGGARIVNAPGFLVDKMELGRANTLHFLTTLH